MYISVGPTPDVYGASIGHTINVLISNWYVCPSLLYSYVYDTASAW